MPDQYSREAAEKKALREKRMKAMADCDISSVPPESDQLKAMSLVSHHEMKILGVQPTGMIIATFSGVVFGRDRLDSISRLKNAGYSWESWPLKNGKTAKGWSMN